MFLSLLRDAYSEPPDVSRQASSMWSCVEHLSIKERFHRHYPFRILHSGGLKLLEEIGYENIQGSCSGAGF